ncbi:Sporulation related domain-containing protein [Novosphingobium sp. CF614]|uniref:SPOR domain-containing protein n=1 Tax=Novosphingobium sp. CF614 TaxID=1884364 RepID=UPI0008EE5853|nr:tetratricopeptide repeat protein [Novosphingobium sp. CF614]SFF98875.1 Sporulation related domain-containing protein [Novosphingobium sp. CF614]
MERITFHARTAGLAVCSAMAAALLAGCSGHAPLASSGKPAPSGDLADAQSAAQSETDVVKAEGRVAKSPRSASARVDLAQAYLAAGRFESAATTFEDAASLGDESPRSGLGLALAYIGSGRNAEALTVLTRWRNQIPASDLGLAVALAGQPAQGVALLSDALRGGDDSAKIRQNLAYAYALDGRWAEARVVASQDVPADQLDARMGEWASRVRPDQYQSRIAGLLAAPVRTDPGQPAALALNGAEQAVRMASADASAPIAELPPVEAGQAIGEAAPSRDVAELPAALATNSVDAPQPASAKFVSQPMVQPASATRSAIAESFAGKGSAQLVQLGSFRTLEGARRAWGIFVARNPALKDHAMRITEANVHGRRYFRVAAEGFDRGSAKALCSTVKQRGGACFAYAEGHALPGALPAKDGSGNQMLASR